MGKLDDQLQKLVALSGTGSGFGDPEALQQHLSEIDLLKFKINRRDNLRLAIVSAIIGAVVGGLVTLVGQFVV